MTTHNTSSQIRPPSPPAQAASSRTSPASDSPRRRRRKPAAVTAAALIIAGAAGASGVMSSHHYQWKATHQARQQFHVTLGDAELTIPAPAPGQILRVSATVGVGALTVDLPAGTTATVASAAGLGAITTPQGSTGGPLRHQHIQIGPGNPQVIIKASVRIGSVTIRTPGPPNAPQTER